MQSFSRQILRGLLAAQKAGVEIDWTFDYRNFHETTYTDEAGTILALPGDVVAYIEDQSGRGNHALQPTLAERMELAITPPRLVAGFNDHALVTVPVGGWQGRMTIATTSGVATYKVEIPAGTYRIGKRSGSGLPGAALIGHALTEDELSPAQLTQIAQDFVAIGGGDYGAVTNFGSFWNGHAEIIEHPFINTSNGENFSFAWRSNTKQNPFPLLDLSKGKLFTQSWNENRAMIEFPPVNIKNGGTFPYAWNNCILLSIFPPNMFDGCLATNFNHAFSNTNLTVDSINGILVSINSNGTSNGTFRQTGGSAPSLAGQQAIDAMRARGWTITVTGGY